MPSGSKDMDLLQDSCVSVTFAEEDMMDGTVPPSSPSPSKKSCFELLAKTYSESGNPLPMECERFEDIKIALQRRNTDPKEYKEDPYVGLSYEDRINAVRAREHGQLNHHQIQRRMTTSTKKDKVWTGNW